MNNLQQAEELKKKIKLNLEVIQFSEENPQKFLSLCILGGKSSVSKLKQINDEIKNYKREAKDLKEKIIKLSKQITEHTTDTNQPIERGLTDDKEKALKILNEILGEE